MKILTNKKQREIAAQTNILHSLIKKNDDSNDAIGALNKICRICDIPTYYGLFQFKHIMYCPGIISPISPPKKEECKHVFEIGFSQNSEPFLFCKHCAKIINLPFGKRQEDKQ